MRAIFRSLFNKIGKKTTVKSDRLAQLESILGIEIDEPSLYQRALRHRSMLSQEQYAKFDSYERLEFLGMPYLILLQQKSCSKNIRRKTKDF